MRVFPTSVCGCAGGWSSKILVAAHLASHCQLVCPLTRAGSGCTPSTVLRAAPTLSLVVISDTGWPQCLTISLPQEKIRPIDKKLHYQVEKLLAAAQAAGTAGAQAAPAAEGAAGAAAEDPLRYGPRPDALVAKVQLPGGCPQDGEHAHLW